MRIVASASGEPEAKVVVIAPFMAQTAARVAEQAEYAVAAGFLPILVAQGTPHTETTVNGITCIGSPLGRGAAIRAGLNHAAAAPACIVVDSAWNVTPYDLDLLRRRLLDGNSSKMILGRWNGASHSLLMRLESLFFALLLRLLCGVSQGAARSRIWGLTQDLVTTVAAVPGPGYECEVGSLIALSRRGCTIDEISLEAPAPQRAPDFRLWRDGVACYLVVILQFFAFMMSSIASMVIDLSLYALVIHAYWHSNPMPKAVISSTIVARIVSSLFNYLVNRNVVFSEESGKLSIMRYYILASGIMTVSALGNSLLAPLMPQLLIVAKFLVDLVLFFVSYLVQKHWVFRDQKNRIS